MLIVLLLSAVAADVVTSKNVLSMFRCFIVRAGNPSSLVVKPTFVKLMLVDWPTWWRGWESESSQCSMSMGDCNIS